MTVYEQACLIEAKHNAYDDRPVMYLADNAHGTYWTTDATVARRFLTEAHANSYLAGSPRRIDGILVTRHEFERNGSQYDHKPVDPPQKIDPLPRERLIEQARLGRD